MHYFLILLFVSTLSLHSDSIKVMTMVPPHAWLVKQVGGEHVEVNSLLGPMQSAETLQLSQKQMRQLWDCQILFTTGLPLEQTLLPKLRSQRPNLQIIDLRQDIRLLQLDEHHPDEHVHGNGTDPHIWLSKGALIKQIVSIHNPLRELSPENAFNFRRNTLFFTSSLYAKINNPDQDREHLKDQLLLVYHPAFGYFADDHGMKQVSLETGGNAPTPKRLAEFQKLANETPFKVLIGQPQINTKQARQLAESLGLAYIEINPMANEPLETIRILLDTLKQHHYDQN